MKKLCVIIVIGVLFIGLFHIGLYIWRPMFHDYFAYHKAAVVPSWYAISANFDRIGFGLLG